MKRAVALTGLALLLVLPPRPCLAQANDACDAPTIIKSLPFKTKAVTTGAADHSAWYRYTARRDISLDLDTADSDYDTLLTVYTGTCDALTEVAYNVRNGTTANGRVILLLRAGDSILIAVDDVGNGLGGTLKLAARKSRPRFGAPAKLTELVRSVDPNPFGGTNGTLVGATALTAKSTAFVASTDGIFVEQGGTLATVAYGGMPTPFGGTVETISRVVAGATKIFFTAMLAGGSIDRAIFAYQDGALVPFVVAGVPTPDGGTLIGWSNAIAAGGDVVFFLGRTSLSPTSTRQQLFSFDGTTMRRLAQEGDASPCGGTLRGIDSSFFAADSQGTRATFVAATTKGDGIFASDGITLTAIACEDDVTPIGGTYRSFGSRPAIDDLGEVYFVARIRGLSNTDEVLWVGSGGATSVVAKPGTTLSTGETIAAIGINTQVAANGAGDVAFVANLVSPKQRAIVHRAHLAAQPEAIGILKTPCPAGGSFRSLDDELALAATGELAFEAVCDGASGTFRKPLGGPPVESGLTTNETPIGPGFHLGAPQLDATGRVAMRGSRGSLSTIVCGARGCAAPTGIAVEGAAIPGAPGQHLATIIPTSLAGDGDTLAFIANTFGMDRGRAVLRTHDGVLEVVAAEGQTLPGGVGTFRDFPEQAPDTKRDATAAVGTDLVAFLADVEHPTAVHGIFAATEDGLTTVALEGETAPNGELFADLSVPVVHRKSVMFRAETDDHRCLFGTRAIGRPLAVVACQGDPLPATIGGTIGAFVTEPSGDIKNFFVVVTVDGGSSEQCLLQYRNGKPNRIRCAGESFIDGGELRDLAPTPNGGPIADPGLQGFLFTTTNDGTGEDLLIAARGDTYALVLGRSAIQAPQSGGTIDSEIFTAPSMSGKAVVFTAGIDGGAASAVFQALVP